MGVIGAIGGVSAPTYRNYQIRSDLYLAEDVVLQGLYRARLLSQTGEGDDEWRYNIAEGIVFKGSDFATRDTSYDEVFALPGSISPEGIQEVAFEQINGAPSPDGDVVLESLTGEKLWIQISPDTAIVGEVAPPMQFKIRFDRVDDDNDEMVICHKPGTPAEQTKTIPESAWGGHNGHGDTVGACSGEGEVEVRNLVYIGTGSTYEGEWIPLTENGEFIVDEEPTYDEDGIYVRRTGDYIEITHYNSADEEELKTMIDAVIIFDSGYVTDVSNASSPNDSENPFDGSVSESEAQDEVTVAPDYRSLLFQTRAEDDKDAILISWSDSPSDIVFVHSSASSVSSSSSSLSSVSVSSNSSSSVSSSASSESSSEGGGSSSSWGTECEDLFYVEADGTIQTTGVVEATIEALGSAITYGAGGPEIQVRADVSRDGGSSWNDLFDDAEIDGGETEIISNMESGEQIVIRVNGKHVWWFWTLFNATYQSNDGTGHIEVLRDGDEPPNYDPYGDQEDVAYFLQNVLDAEGKIDIGAYDVILLTELDTVSGDYQDAVIHISFEQTESCE